MKSIKFQLILLVTFPKTTENVETKYVTIYFNSKTKIIHNGPNVDDSLQTYHQNILPSFQKWLGEGSGWIIKPVHGDYISISNVLGET